VGGSSGVGMRTPMQCYGGLMRAFRDEFKAELGSLIEERGGGVWPLRGAQVGEGEAAVAGVDLAGQGWAGLGWAGLGWAGLGWAGLGWAGLGWAGLGWAGLGWAGPCALEALQGCGLLLNGVGVGLQMGMVRMVLMVHGFAVCRLTGCSVGVCSWWRPAASCSISVSTLATSFASSNSNRAEFDLHLDCLEARSGSCNWTWSWPLLLLLLLPAAAGIPHMWKPMDGGSLGWASSSATTVGPWPAWLQQQQQRAGRNGGMPGLTDSGGYNSSPGDTGFFAPGGSWDSGETLLGAASSV